jgi:7,8-didemethyl-8-hydroxy-5-deazariboflavin synthase CofG subunit
LGKPAIVNRFALKSFTTKQLRLDNPTTQVGDALIHPAEQSPLFHARKPGALRFDWADESVRPYAGLHRAVRIRSHVSFPRTLGAADLRFSEDMRVQENSSTAYLDELRDGLPLSRAGACQLLRCPDDDLPALLSTALQLKQRFKPCVVTYSRKVFIPLTNLCRDYCGYCTFRRDPGQPGAHTMTPDEIMEVVHSGEQMGCTEALFSLGDKPELIFAEMRATLRHLGYKSTLHYLEAMCERVLRESTLLPHPNPGLLSAEWIARLAEVSPSMGLMLETTNAALLAPGAAHDNAPDKVPAKRLRTIEEAGKQSVPFTTGLLIGIGETIEDRVDTLLAIRELHQRYGHIQEVIVQNFRVKPEIPMRDWPEPTRGEMLRTVAVARLLMPVMNIQAPPNLSAPYFEELLDAGINDWGGVSPLTPDFINPEKPWPHLEQLKTRTESRGYILRQRLPVYPEFLTTLIPRPGLLSEKVRDAADREGYAARRKAA